MDSYSNSIHQLHVLGYYCHLLSSGGCSGGICSTWWTSGPLRECRYRHGDNHQYRSCGRCRSRTAVYQPPLGSSGLTTQAAPGVYQTVPGRRCKRHRHF